MALPNVGVLLVLVGVAALEANLRVSEAKVLLDKGDGGGVQVFRCTRVKRSIADDSVFECLVKMN